MFGPFPRTAALLLGTALLLSGCGREGNLEKAAAPVVTAIIQEQLKGNARCVAVRITRKLSAGHYQAVATLSNGKDIRIMIEDGDDKIRVSIPRDQE